MMVIVQQLCNILKHVRIQIVSFYTNKSGKNETLFILIIQKAYGPYWHVLESADVGVMWSHLVTETGEAYEYL